MIGFFDRAPSGTDRRSLSTTKAASSPTLAMWHNARFHCHGNSSDYLCACDITAPLQVPAFVTLTDNDATASVRLEPDGIERLAERLLVPRCCDEFGKILDRDHNCQVIWILQVADDLRDAVSSISENCTQFVLRLPDGHGIATDLNYCVDKAIADGIPASVAALLNAYDYPGIHVVISSSRGGGWRARA